MVKLDFRAFVFLYRSTTKLMPLNHVKLRHRRMIASAFSAHSNDFFLLLVLCSLIFPFISSSTLSRRFARSPFSILFFSLFSASFSYYKSKTFDLLAVILCMKRYSRWNTWVEQHRLLLVWALNSFQLWWCFPLSVRVCVSAVWVWHSPDAVARALRGSDEKS